MTRPLPAAVLGLPLAILAACAVRAPVHPRAAEQLVRGYDHLARGDAERAEIAFAHALEFDPDLPEALNGAGVVERSRGDLEAARRRFEAALANDMGFAEGHANLGETLLALGRPHDGVRALRAALAIDPDLADARQNLARALLHRGLEDEAAREEAWRAARREYLHLLETEPDRAAAHHDLAFMDYHRGRWAEAEAGWARAAELQPSVEALHGVCIARARQGRCAEAASACERCLALDGSATRCRESLAAARACSP